MWLAQLLLLDTRGRYVLQYVYNDLSGEHTMEFFETNGIRYVIRYPSGFDTAKSYPTLLFLHGAGSRGTDFHGLVDDNIFFDALAKRPDFPFVVAAPLCTENTWFDMMERLIALTRHVAALDFVDADRLYLMGTSMGGYAAWQLAMSVPDAFAALVPICGGGMYWNASRLKNTPVWAFHGAIDPVVSVEESVKMVEKINAKGGNARLTIYPETGHNAWEPTYENDEVYAFLLSHKKGSADISAEGDLTGAKLYG